MLQFVKHLVEVLALSISSGVMRHLTPQYTIQFTEFCYHLTFKISPLVRMQTLGISILYKPLPHRTLPVVSAFWSHQGKDWVNFLNPSVLTRTFSLLLIAGSNSVQSTATTSRGLLVRNDVTGG